MPLLKMLRQLGHMLTVLLEHLTIQCDHDLANPPLKYVADLSSHPITVHLENNSICNCAVKVS